MPRYRRRTVWLFSLLVLSAIVFLVGATGALAQNPTSSPRGGWQPGPDSYHPSRVIVRFQDTVSAEVASESVGRLGYTLGPVAEFEPSASLPGGLRIGVINLPSKETPDAAVDKLSRIPGIAYAERDYVRYKDQAVMDSPIMPNDSNFSQMWGLHNQNCQYVDPRMGGTPVDDADIDAPEAWGIFTGSESTLAAIIDTGCYILHPDLAANIWVNPGEIPGNGIDDDHNGYIDDIWGWDWFNGDNSVWDPDERDSYGYLNDEHGTHTSGTIGAVTNNAMGVAGINWNIKVMVLKFLGPDGGYTSDAILAFGYAANKGAKVISCSWGGGGYNQALKDAIEATHALVPCAAGNSGDNTDVNPHYPSSYDSDNIISVAAMMQNETPCNYSGWWSSCWGPTSVDLYAPGGYILSTIPPDPPPSQPAEAYDFFYGTSMATPHVSGTAALVHSLRPSIALYPGAPGWTPGQPTVKDIILESVDVKPAYQGKVLTSGRLNAGAAIAGLGGPVITSIDAQPRFGPPPLEVTFTASAMSPDGEILDKWWDFGDGSAPVHEFNTVHTYTEQGDFTATFHALDNEGLEATASVTIKVFFPPVIDVDPDEIHVDLWWGDTQMRELAISNTGLGDLNYSVSVKLVGKLDASGQAKLGRGGPDSFGYFWLDTDEPGMAPPDWLDIRSMGTPVTLGDDSGVVVDLPFEFPFYGQTKSQIAICSNGYLTFGSSLGVWTNADIPSTMNPNDLIAPFWDDLTLSSSGTCHYYGDEDMFIVQYTNVPRLGSGGPYTFQVWLTPQGTITYVYETMQGTRLNEATIGIENDTGTVGLRVAYNQPYVHDDLGIVFLPGWLICSSTGGTIDPGSTDVLDLMFFADHLPKGTWKAIVEITSNDPANPKVDVNTFMFVRSRIVPRIRSASANPWAGSAPLEVHFSLDAYDQDGTVVDAIWDFGDGSPTVSGTFSPVHTYAAEGNYTATVTVIDDDGFEASADIAIVVADLPQATVDPTSFNQVIRAHRLRTETLTVTNTGVAPLEFAAAAYTAGVPTGANELEPLGGGGPDSYGYMWRDSDEPGGPAFDWVEIGGIGTKLPVSGDDSREVDLPFEFPFYGDAKTSIRICSDGYLTFGTKGNAYTNAAIPNPAEPNDMMAVYWDDLNPPSAPADGGVFYYHDAVNNRFVVQWNKVPRYYNNGQYTFQAILYPNGAMVYQYLNMEFASATYAKDGTIGVENAAGTDGLQVLHNTEGYMHNNLAIRIKPISWMSVWPNEGELAPGESMDLDVTFDLALIGSGTLDGAVVLDTNDIRRPRTIVPVHIQVIPNSPPVITACAVNPQQGPPGSSFQFVAAGYDPDGSLAEKYWSFGDGSPAMHQFVADHVYTAEGVYTATFTVIDNDGYTATSTVKVTVAHAASASWHPGQFSFMVGGGQAATGILTLANAGPGTLVFGSGEFPSQVQMPERLVLSEGIKNYEVRTAFGLYEPVPNPEKSEWLPDAVGSVMKSWTCPSPIGDPWGVGVLFDSDEVVIADGAVDPTDDYVVTSDGAYTGRYWSADFGGSWAGDMAFDGTFIWQVNVGGDNAIHKIDPANGHTVGSISNAAWAGVSQRGLAYNANDDTFYIGGWNEDIIYKFKGESWGNPGEVIEQWSMPVSIAGLAYHPVADVLLVSANSSPDMIYLVNATTHATLGQFQHPAHGDYMGVGIELARDGNLWVASWGENKMYLVETGLGPIGSGSWLTWEPSEGSVPAGGSVPITITANSEKLTPGVHTGNVVLTTNDIENPLIVVPVALQVAAPPAITEAAAEPVFGEPPLVVTFHAAFVAPEVPVVSYGWDFGDGTSSATLDAAHTYTLPGSYKATFAVVDQLGATAEASVDIVVTWAPHATVDPTLIELTLPPKAVVTETVTVGNVDGNAPLNFSVKVKSGSAPFVAMPKRIGSITDPNAATAEGLYLPFDPTTVQRIAGNVQPDGVGDILRSWPAPSAVDIAWGLGFDSANVWLADPLNKKDYIITPEGVFTGMVFNTPWAGSWPGDMAYDSTRNLIWQVNVGGDNGIYGLDPATGAVVTSVTSGGAWASTSQRGLGYDADTDTFYIGGWNEDIIYHIMGPSWSTPGAVIAAYSFPVSIAGLEYHPDGVLWVSTNSAPDMIYGIDMESLAVIHQFQHPYHGDYSGAGLALHDDGNLWVASQEDNYVYLVNTEMPISAGIGVQPSSGAIPQGTTADLAVTINAAELGKPGEDVRKYLEITTNDPANPALFVDLVVHIEAGPTIADATAVPNIGHPPLTVAFDATVEPGAKPITDIWWEFGDGSEPVHQLQVDHVYIELGEYVATLHVIDANDLEVTAEVKVTVKWLPILETYPSSFDETIQVGEQEQTMLTVSNTGVAPMSFGVSVAPSFADSPEWKRYAESAPAKGDYAAEPRGYAGAGAGGPDLFGYIWMDSSEPHGPEFNWIEISAVGSSLAMSDETIVSVPLPFAFPFYGTAHNQVRVCSNGYLTFGTGGSTWTNTPIPNPDGPNSLIAPFWDDLTPGSTGSVYYYYDEANNQFIVEYKNMSQWGSTADLTFEVILRPNGAIVYQYKTMIGDLTSATVGIENDTGTDGLQVVYNAPYIEDGIAIAFAPVGKILTVSPTSGYLLPGNHQDVVVTLGDAGGVAGEFSLYIYVSANDPFRPFAAIPVHLVINLPPAVTITAPAAGAELHGITEIKWTAADPDNAADELAIDLYWTRDGETWNTLGEGMENTGVFTWNTIEVGAGGDTFQLRARVTDPVSASSEFTTGEFAIVNLAPTAAFSLTPSPATRRDVVKFTDESTDDGTIVARLWEFGDGATSDIQNPEHQYAAKGDFTIRLTVTDNGGLTGTAEHTITVGNAVPIAAFSFAPESPSAGEVVTFTNESTDDAEIVACFWEFGDGATSVGHNPTHAYAASGVFTVRLTVIDDDSVADSAEHSVEVVNTPPVAAFSFAPSPATVLDVVKFTDETTDDGEIVAWHWEFGDGAESDKRNPEHKYAAKGKFTVKLTVTDDGDLSDSAEHEIAVKNLPPEVRLLKPTAGVVWTGEQTIEWEATDPDDEASALKITLEYALQADGSEWKSIATNQDNAGKHKWDTSQVTRGGRYKVRATAVDPDGGSAGATSEEFVIVVLTRAIVAAPNPARDSVTFYYDIPADGTLHVYDIAGRLIYSVSLPASMHAYEWNLHAGSRPLANGVYLYIVVGDAQKSEVGRLVVNR